MEVIEGIHSHGALDVFQDPQHILRHGNCTKGQQLLLSNNYGPHKGITWGHELAIRQWCENMSAIPSVVAVSAAQDMRHLFMLVRILLETKGSFSSLKSWVSAAGQISAQKVRNYRNLKHICAPSHCTSDSHPECCSGTCLCSASRLTAENVCTKWEIGAFVWKSPAALQDQRADLEKGGCISCLGERCPWIAERLIGMHEFPNEMDMDGKASMVEAAVRNATVQAGGEVDMDLHKQVLQGTRVWTSDGADLDVGLSLGGGRQFDNLVCHAWDESHGAGRLLANAMKHDAEIQEVDRLLVTGKKPYSLAKCVSTSEVFR